MLTANLNLLCIGLKKVIRSESGKPIIPLKTCILPCCYCILQIRHRKKKSRVSVVGSVGRKTFFFQKFFFKCLCGNLLKTPVFI